MYLESNPLVYGLLVPWHERLKVMDEPLQTSAEGLSRSMYPCSYHGMPGHQVSFRKSLTISEAGDTYAMMFTLFPFAFASIVSANLAARASIEPDAGTVAVMTSIFLRLSASRIPRQYWIPGSFWPTRWSSSNPRSPWARITGFLGAAVFHG
jgi:hypothetical protein